MLGAARATVGGGPGGQGGGIEALFDRLGAATDEAQAMQLCQHLLRELGGNDRVYRMLLQRFLGFEQRPLQGTDGGWLNRPRRSRGDVRYQLLSAEARYKWNLYHHMVQYQERRELQLDEQLLPARSQDFLHCDLQADPTGEGTETFNSKRLYNEIYANRTMIHARGGGAGAAGGVTGAGGGAAAAGGPTGAGEGAFTRLPLVLPMLDHYYFLFAHWALARKRSPGDNSGGLSTHKRRELYDYELRLARGGVNTQAIVARPDGVYFQLVQSYVRALFPRETGPEARGQQPGGPVDLARVLRMSPDAERFLRILIESWLERSVVQNPMVKVQPPPEPSDAENQLHPGYQYFSAPTADSLHALLVVVSHMMARKVDADVATLAGTGRGGLGAGGMAGAAGGMAGVGRMLGGMIAGVGGMGGGGFVRECPALDALHQPLYVFLNLTFRHLRVAPHSWTQFFLAVELWLAWIDPERTWRQTFADRGAPGSGGAALGARWREQHLRAHVASHYHFYSTLLVLYMRKAREALGSDPSRQYQVLAQALRVMRAFHDTALHDVLSLASREAAEVWQAVQWNKPISHRHAYLERHLRIVRLLRSRPCLVEDAGQDAHHLAAELLAVKQRAEKEWEDAQRPWTSVGKILRWLGRTANAIFGDDTGPGAYYEEPPSGGSVKLPDLIEQLGLVLEELYGVFPGVRAKCEARAGDEGDLAARRDADRKGLLLTQRGRDQLLMGLRGCDPTKARYLGDPLFNPEVGQHEVPLLVTLAQRLSIKLNAYFHPTWVPPPEVVAALQPPPPPQPAQQPQPAAPAAAAAQPAAAAAQPAAAAAAAATVAPQHLPAGPKPFEGGHVDVGCKLAREPAPINVRWLADARIYQATGGAILAMVALRIVAGILAFMAGLVAAV